MAASISPDNPIVWQEVNYQERSAPRTRLIVKILAPLVLLVTVAAVASTLNDLDAPTREIGILAIWTIHSIVALYALAAGANAISREHVGLTWDALVLTGVSARQILFGKWRAVLHRVAPWMLLLGTVRLAMIPIFMIALVNVYGSYVLQYRIYSSNYSGYPDLSVEISWVPWASILAVVMTVVLTLLEVMGCTALGLATSAITRRGSTATFSAILLRFSPVVLLAWFTRNELGSAADNAYRVLRFAPFAIADGGTAPLSRLSVPYTPFSLTTHLDALYGLFMATVVMITFLVMSLFIAWIAIRRNGALPHEKRRRRSWRLPRALLHYKI